MANRDFIALGDITTDAFIDIKDATVNCDIDRNTNMLCVRFGDKIPYEKVTVVPAVGNAPNAAVSAHRLGLESALVTNLGDDMYGKEQIAQLEKEGVDCEYVTVHEGADSNYHFVLQYEEERTILVKHYEYKYAMPDIGAPQWLYLSSLAENSVPYHHEIAEYVRSNRDINLAFQPGTFQMQLGYEELKDIYEVSKIFFVNKDEAKRILMTDDDDIKHLLEGITRLGPEIAVVTDGPDGAYAYDGADYWHMPMYPDPAPPVDRTGAGDSFSSTVVAALALGEDLPTALSWGPINSMSVVQYIGAQEGLLIREKLFEHLENRPEHYQISKI